MFTVFKICLFFLLHSTTAKVFIEFEKSVFVLYKITSTAFTNNGSFILTEVKSGKTIYYET